LPNVSLSTVGPVVKARIAADSNRASGWGEWRCARCVRRLSLGGVLGLAWGNVSGREAHRQTSLGHCWTFLAEDGLVCRCLGRSSRLRLCWFRGNEDFAQPQDLAKNAKELPSQVESFVRW